MSRLVDSPLPAPLPFVSSIRSSSFSPPSIVLVSGVSCSGRRSLLRALHHRISSGEFSGYRVAPLESTKLQPIVDAEEPGAPFEVLLSAEEFSARSFSFLFQSPQEVGGPGKAGALWGISIEEITKILTEGNSALIFVPLPVLSQVERFLVDYRISLAATAPPPVRLLWLKTPGEIIQNRLNKEDSINIANAGKSQPKPDKLASKRFKVVSDQISSLAVAAFAGRALPPPDEEEKISTTENPAVKTIFNGGSMSDSVAQALEILADLRSAEPPEAPKGSGVVQNASDYLIENIYPALSPALARVETIRPADPIEFLALEMLKNSRRAAEQAGLVALVQKEKIALRENLQEQYKIQGRV